MNSTGRYKPYPAYKDSGVEWLGEVPVHWETWKTSHGFKCIGSGTTPDTTDETNFEGDMPWVTTSELRETYIYAANKQVSIQALAGYSALKVYSPGTILIAMYGATIGRLGILGCTATVNQACCAFADSDIFSPKYVYYWLYMRRPILISLSSGGGQPNLSQDDLKKVKIPTPPLPEQAAIAAFLDSETARIDALIAKKRRLIELLAEKRAAVISHAVTKGLDPDAPMKDSGVEWLGEVPAHWEVLKTRRLFDFVTSGSRGWAQYYSDDGEIFFRITNLSRDSINILGEDIRRVDAPAGSEGERSRIKKNDLLISITADLGSVAVATDSFEGGYVSQHVALARPGRRVDSARWLGYACLARQTKEQFAAAGYGGTKIQLSLDDIRDVWIACPPSDEQDVISKHLDHATLQIDTLTTKSQAAIAKLQEYRTALITAAVTGKIDVRGEAVS